MGMGFAELRNFIEMMTEPLRQRILMTISRAVLESVDDTTGVQLVKLQLLAEEVRDNVERMQQFGFTSNPPPGSEAIVAFVGGDREHGAVLGCDDRKTRFKPLGSGETAIYTSDGTVIHLKKGGEVEVLAATKVTVNVPESEFSGNVTIKGNLAVEGNGQINGNLDVDGNIGAGGNVSGTNVTATGAVSGATVATSGGTDLDSIKTAYNGHTHPPGATDPPSTSIP